MEIRLRLSNRNNKKWDREIIKWLKGIPLGYRTTVIKQILYNCISNQHSMDTGIKNQPSKADEDLDKGIKNILNFKA